MTYDIIVVGAGHAGCEAALASSRLGNETLLITGNKKNIADCPCNPSIGGSAKGIVVREIDEKKAQGIGVFTVDGKMIDVAFYDGAKRTIDLAKASGVYHGTL